MAFAAITVDACMVRVRTALGLVVQPLNHVEGVDGAFTVRNDVQTFGHPIVVLMCMSAISDRFTQTLLGDDSLGAVALAATPANLAVAGDIDIGWSTHNALHATISF